MKSYNIDVSLNDNVTAHSVAGQKSCTISLKQQGNIDRNAEDSEIPVESNEWTWNDTGEEDFGLTLLFSNSATKEKPHNANDSTVLPTHSSEILLAISQEEKNITVVTSDTNGRKAGRLEEVFSGDSTAFQQRVQHIGGVKNNISGRYGENHKEFDYEFRRNIIQHFLETVEQERLSQL